ncbi:TAXI family TRAP transporter solute-binding subunit [Desulfovibrio sp. OttesenSCG-928-G11]|nr:TAXI family TRAP transporter solute-binding subunit [Desulfovibrio sp. OttesenSCG-928-G11]
MSCSHKCFALLLIYLIVALPCSALAEADKSGWPVQLRFMSGPQGGNWFTLGTVMADTWSKEVLRANAVAGGGMANITGIESRKGDMGFAVASFLGAALAGEEDFRGAKVNNVVIMANLYKQVTYFIVAKDFAESRNIRTTGDLIKQDKVRFASLKPGTASEFAVKALFAMGYGTSPGELKSEKQWSLEYLTYEGGADAIANGDIDCFAFSVGSAASIVSSIESKVNIHILSVEETALQAVAAAYGTTAHTIAPGTYASVRQPVTTLGDYTCIVIRKDLPESLVFELNKSLWSNKAHLVETVRDMAEFSPATALPEGVPCHPGSTRFWNGLTDTRDKK